MSGKLLRIPEITDSYYNDSTELLTGWSDTNGGFFGGFFCVCSKLT